MYLLLEVVMNRLKGTHCYLAGAMDRVRDNGIGWRRKIKDQLNDLEILWFDPTCKPSHMGIEDENTRKAVMDAKKKGHFNTVAEILRPIRCVDLRMIDLSDFIIVFLDRKNSGFGTIEEITLANREKKPILICQEDGKRLATTVSQIYSTYCKR